MFLNITWGLLKQLRNVIRRGQTSPGVPPAGEAAHRNRGRWGPAAGSARRARGGGSHWGSGCCSSSWAARAQQGRGSLPAPLDGPHHLLLWDGVWMSSVPMLTGQGRGKEPPAPQGPQGGLRAPEWGCPHPLPCPLPPLRPPQAKGPGASACSESLRFFRIIRTQRLQTPGPGAGGFAAAPDHGEVGMGWGVMGTNSP